MTLAARALAVLIETSKQISRYCHNRFLLNPFQFIYQQSPCYSALYSPKDLATLPYPEQTEAVHSRTFSFNIHSITSLFYRITGVSDFIHRPDFNNYRKKNKHDVSETESVSVLR
jgi:hypothetical protein